MNRTLLLLAAAAALIAPASAQSSLNGVFINEVLVDPVGPNFNFDTDGDGVLEASDEFIEFYNGSAQSVDLSGYLVYTNQGAAYIFPMGTTIPAGGYLVLTTDYTGTVPPGYFTPGIAVNALNDNGDGIYVCDPNSGDYIAAGYLSVDAPTLPGTATECTNLVGFDDLGDDIDGLSIQRESDGGAAIGVGFPSPLATNELGVAVVSSEFAGWRMLSAPGFGLTVNDLAGINLVRGIATDDTDPPNLYTIYGGDQTPGGDDGYTPPAGATTALTPGAGFFWYFFDFNNPPALDPQVLGSIRPLPISINANVTPLATDQTVAFPVRTVNDGFYLAGNPFNSQFELSGISVASDPVGTALTVQDVINVWSPSLNGGAGGYVQGSLSGTGASSIATPWQGFWLEILETATSTPPTTVGVDVTYAIASAGATGGTFIGRQAAYADIKVEIRGVAADGRALTNQVSLLFHEEADAGWDRFDSSSPGSFGTPYVLAGLIGPRGDVEKWKYQDSRPFVAGSYTFPLAYTSVGTEGALTLAWPDLSAVPDDWNLRLRDAVTGAELDLRTQPSYTFERVDDEPRARFEVVVEASSVANEDEGLPTAASIGEIYPNPAASTATLTAQVAETQDADIAVYDVLGRQVLADRLTLRAGVEERVAFGVAALPAGTYVVRLAGASFAETRRLTVVR